MIIDDPDFVQKAVQFALSKKPNQVLVVGTVQSYSQPIDDPELNALFPVSEAEPEKADSPPSVTRGPLLGSTATRSTGATVKSSDKPPDDGEPELVGA